MIDFYSFSKVYFFTAFFQSLLLSTSEQEHVNFLLFFLIIQIQIKEQKKICQCSNSIEVPCREHPAVNFTISLGAQSQDMMMMKLLMMMKMWVFCCPPVWNAIQHVKPKRLVMLHIISSSSSFVSLSLLLL